MAGTKSKKHSGFAKFYLASYNLGQVSGWSYILYQVIQYYIKPSSSNTLWDNISLPLIIFQNLAVLEVIHAATGLVPSNVIVTMFQLLSRVICVCGVILATPYTYAAASIGLPLAIIAWSITEVIRYSYYFMNLVAIVPHIIIWLRYTTFIVLYPVGVTGELLCSYAAVRYARAFPDSWSYALPNKWNFTFSYHYFLMIFMFMYLPIFPYLYLHMFSQRRKVLNTDATTKKIR